MKNILLKIVAGIALIPVLVYGQVNTMYFCCSRQVGGGCSPIAYSNETACKAACTETESCEVRSVGTAAVAPMVPPMAPYGYSAYGPGMANIEAMGAAIDTAAQEGVLPARAPLTTTVDGMPVQQTVAPVATTVSTPGTTRATRQVTTVTTTTGTVAPVAATNVAADMVGTGTAATNVSGNQIR
jgi:hypothetical protein